MKVSDLFKKLEDIYKFNTQDVWDVSRSEIFNDEKVKNIIISLDVTNKLIENAITNNCNVIITHHPLFTDFEIDKDFVANKLFDKLKQYKINTIFLHTPFDKSKDGMNVHIAKKLNLQNLCYGNSTKDFIIAELPMSSTIGEFSKFIKSQFPLEGIRYDKYDENVEIKKIGLCAGSGSSLIYEINNSEIDVFITGDIKYHAWVDAKEIKIPLIEVPHEIENIFIDIIANLLSDWGLEKKSIQYKVGLNLNSI
ncbi:MAG: Nif3-like dinuclear metal center hexameric protein [Mycoplasma sp.]